MAMFVPVPVCAHANPLPATGHWDFSGEEELREIVGSEKNVGRREGQREGGGMVGRGR